jgi:ribulose-phosphate 3-epimerase
VNDSLIGRLRTGARLSAGVTGVTGDERVALAAALRTYGVEVVHVDHSDGSFGVPAAPPTAHGAFDGLVRDVHVLSARPLTVLDEALDAEPHLVTVHAEAEHASRALGAIAGAGVLAGIALTPATPLEAARELIDSADLVLVLTLDPRDLGAEADHGAALERLDALRAGSGAARGRLLAVDGRVDAQRAARYARAGANLVVAGRALLRGDVARNVQDFTTALAPRPHTTAPSGARREHVNR